MTEKPIINRVAQSALITINPKDFLPSLKDCIALDLEPFLFRGLLLKEKEFRTAVTEYDWSAHANRITCVFCSTDAIVPHWAYMLVASKLPQSKVYFGKIKSVSQKISIEQIRSMDVSPYVGKKIILKGCADPQVNQQTYLELTKKLLPVVQSLMYGEACSTVPIYKK